MLPAATAIALSGMPSTIEASAKNAGLRGRGARAGARDRTPPAGVDPGVDFP